MIVIIVIMLQVTASCLGNEGYITVLNIKPSSDDQNKYQCYTPSTFTNYSLSYGRSFEIRGNDNLTEFYWTVKANEHKYVTVKAWNTGVYYCKIVMDGVTTTVETTKIKSTAKTTPSRTSSSITTNAGDEVTIAFDTNFNARQLIWRKDSDILNSVTGKNLTFKSVNINDTGMYEVHRRENRHKRNHAFTKLIVRACPRHRWGLPDCTGDCNYCYNGGVCDDKTGLCICAPGFMGPTCEKECGNTRFGWNCENSCPLNSNSSVSTCRNVQFCLPDPYGCSCGTGLKGLSCTTACSSGKFGADCTQSCHCKQGECNRYTGRCTDAEDPTCAPPWTGSNCQKCEPRFFGENNCETEAPEEEDKTNAAIGGGVGAAICTMVVVVIIILCCKQRQNEEVSKSKDNASTNSGDDRQYENIFQKKSSTEGMDSGCKQSQSHDVNTSMEDGTVYDQAYVNDFPVKCSAGINNYADNVDDYMETAFVPQSMYTSLKLGKQK